MPLVYDIAETERIAHMLYVLIRLGDAEDLIVLTLN